MNLKLFQKLKHISMNFTRFIKWIAGFLKFPGTVAKVSGGEVNQDTVYRDLLEKVRQLEQLMKEEADKNEKLKTTFLNNIYHEIRTPMNSIVGFAELLKQNGLSEEKKESYISKIKQGSEEFLKLLDLLLDASLIESGNLRLTNSNCRLEQLIDELYTFYTIQKHVLEKNNIAFLRNTDKYYPGLQISSDKNRLYKILSNLLDNAFKFTDKGVIEFGYKVINTTQIMFYVKDSGLGIGAEEAPDLFHKFRKNEYCRGKDFRGLGLGLSISKGLIDLMGGKIWVEKNSFGGATFKFTIPYEIIYMPAMEKNKEKPRLSRMLYYLL